MSTGGLFILAKIISISNQKGGVGKTTTTCSIAANLKSRGFKVLCIDLDPQSNLTFSVGGQADDCATVYELIKGDVKAIYAIQKTESFDIIASNILLSGVELEFTQTGREFLLKEALAPLDDRYDYIFIDTPPALGILTVNAFTASDSILIPMLADIFSLQGLAQLSETVDRVRTYCNNKLRIDGIILTKFNARTLLSKEVLGTASIIADEIETRLFKNSIRTSVAIMEAQTHQQDIFVYAPKNNASYDYEKIVDEFLDYGL